MLACHAAVASRKMSTTMTDRHEHINYLAAEVRLPNSLGILKLEVQVLVIFAIPSMPPHQRHHVLENLEEDLAAATLVFACSDGLLICAVRKTAYSFKRSHRNVIAHQSLFLDESRYKGSIPARYQKENRYRYKRQLAMHLR